MAFSFFKKINNFFPTPRFLSFDLVSLDITPRYIRAMKLRESKYGIIPDYYKEIKLKNKNELSSFGSKRDFSTEAFTEIVDVLKNLKKDFKSKFVVVSLPETNTYIYRTKLPAESIKTLIPAIRFNLEENVPLKADDVNFDYFIIDDDKKPGDDIDIVISVFPKEIINVYTKTLKMAGLFPISFQSESVSLSRATVRKGDKDTYLLLRFLRDQVNVGVVEDGAVQYATIIHTDVDKIVNDYGSETASDLNESLNKTLIYWFTNKQGGVQHKKIETALISGDYALSDGLREFLEKKLKINVEMANVWSNCFSLDDYVPKIKKGESLNYAVAVGLAIKGITHA